MKEGELKVNIKDIANIKFHCIDLEREVTVKDYLKELLSSLWEQGESFSGKRPFGNSGWKYDLYTALVEGGAIKGVLDEDGNIDGEFNKREADRIIFKVIKGL